MVALLELAKAFGRLKTPPRRSVLFIATTGEEHELLGAKYYTAHPLYPLERTLANLNIDVINVWGPTRDVGIMTKMSKSLDNAIALGARADEIRKAVRAMYTDEQHLRASDPGRVEGNVVFAFLDAFEPDVERVAELKAHYLRGGLGDSVVKGILEERLQALVAPIRAERERLAADRASIMQILREGTEHARERTAATVGEVKRALGLTYFI